MKDCLWTWSPEKDSVNRSKHGFGFDLAAKVFDDPLHVSDIDPHSDGDRWRTLGAIKGVVVLVVHTDPHLDGDRLIAPGRIISARKATANERRLFSEAIYGGR